METLLGDLARPAGPAPPRSRDSTNVLAGVLETTCPASRATGVSNVRAAAKRLPTFQPTVPTAGSTRRSTLVHVDVGSTSAIVIWTSTRFRRRVEQEAALRRQTVSQVAEAILRHALEPSVSRRRKRNQLHEPPRCCNILDSLISR
jgi:hypothetical protein